MTDEATDRALSALKSASEAFRRTLEDDCDPGLWADQDEEDAQATRRDAAVMLDAMLAALPGMGQKPAFKAIYETNFINLDKRWGYCIGNIDECATAVLNAIITGKVPHVTITY